MNPMDSLAARIDHTLLKPEADAAAIDRLCAEAAEHGFWSVCILPGWLERARAALTGSGVHLCTVIGFPLGGTLTGVKAYEAARCVEAGADELDMVINVGALRSDDAERVREDVAAVVAAAAGRLVKVIIETSLLGEAQKRRACELAVAAGADFVKTSTGFAGGGATVEDVRLMRAVVGPDTGVKASGGIRSRADALAMLEAGADRIGTSAGIAIVTGGNGGAYGY